MECNFCHPSGLFANYDGDVANELADHIDDTTVHLTSQDRQVLSDIENDLTQFATKEDLNNYYTKQLMDDFEYVDTGYLEDNQIVNKRYLEDNHYANEEYVDTTIDAKLAMLDVDDKISNCVDDAYDNMQNYVIESLESIAPSVINNVDTTEYTLSNGDTIKLVLDNKNLSLNIAKRMSVVLSSSATTYRYNNGSVITIGITATSTGNWAGYMWKYVVNGADTSYGSNTPSNTTVSIPAHSTTAQTVVLGYKKINGEDTWHYSNTVTVSPGYFVICYANSENNVSTTTLNSGEVLQKSSGNYVLYTNKNEVEFEVTANGGQYIFFGCPVSWGNVMFKDTSTGLSETWALCGPDFKADGVSYRQYKSTNSNLGTVKYKLV